MLDSFGAPDRNPIVAQRMIGAHLGLKLKNNNTNLKSSLKRTSNNTSTSDVQMKDAWDD